MGGPVCCGAFLRPFTFMGSLMDLIAYRRRAAPAITGCLLLCSVTGLRAQQRPAKVPELDRARQITAEMSTELAQELRHTQERAGEEAATTFCKREGRRVARELSEKHGWRVGRTSVQARNRKNAADAWEATVLKSFAARKAAGEDPEAGDGFERWEWVGGEFRYMKAITVKETCLACHGAKIDKTIRKKIDQSYEADPACDYRVGEIRGAFTLTLPGAEPTSLAGDNK